MLYKSASHWRDAPEKKIMLFGMSGLGKTYVSSLLRDTGNWFHYSVDYRIGTRYMGEHIADNFKAEAMKVPLLANLLMSDSVHITSNITFENLEPLSTYLGKPGDPAKGGLAMKDYARRQKQHHAAEAAAMYDTGHFIERAKLLYGYNNFICDTSGSICEIVDPEDPNDAVLKELSDKVLMVWIKGDAAHTEELIRRFDAAPKPMFYRPDFLTAAWSDYLAETNAREETVDPDAFIRWTYARALKHRAPRYQSMAENWGITVSANDVAQIKTEDDMTDMIAQSLPA